ncbi:hypothetical protein ABH931_004044 [Streptacidiphilus sp. MAP12-33]|uniref:hypothetical protein n=1 Tax=Streptacidiphilus sp. MAP12-33 TaxID=3156266 RepID=UPI00351841A5
MKQAPYWLDRPERPAPGPALTGDVVCDLAVVGGGLTELTMMRRPPVPLPRNPPAGSPSPTPAAPWRTRTAPATARCGCGPPTAWA